MEGLYNKKNCSSITPCFFSFSWTKKSTHAVIHICKLNNLTINTPDQMQTISILEKSMYFTNLLQLRIWITACVVIIHCLDDQIISYSVHREVNLELEKNLLCLVHLAGQFMGSNLHRVMPNNLNLCPLQAISLTFRFSSRRYFKLLSYSVVLQLSWSSERSFLVLELTCSQQDNLKELCSPVHTTSFLTTLLADFSSPS